MYRMQRDYLYRGYQKNLAELEDLIDTVVVTKTAALAIMRSLWTGTENQLISWYDPRDMIYIDIRETKKVAALKKWLAVI